MPPRKKPTRREVELQKQLEDQRAQIAALQGERMSIWVQDLGAYHPEQINAVLAQPNGNSNNNDVARQAAGRTRGTMHRPPQPESRHQQGRGTMDVGDEGVGVGRGGGGGSGNGGVGERQGRGRDGPHGCRDNSRVVRPLPGQSIRVSTSLRCAVLALTESSRGFVMATMVIQSWVVCKGQRQRAWTATTNSLNRARVSKQVGLVSAQLTMTMTTIIPKDPEAERLPWEGVASQLRLLWLAEGPVVGVHGVCMEVGGCEFQANWICAAGLS